MLAGVLEKLNRPQALEHFGRFSPAGVVGPTRAGPLGRQSAPECLHANLSEQSILGLASSHVRDLTGCSFEKAGSYCVVVVREQPESERHAEESARLRLVLLPCVFVEVRVEPSIQSTKILGTSESESMMKLDIWIAICPSPCRCCSVRRPPVETHAFDREAPEERGCIGQSEVSLDLGFDEAHVAIAGFSDASGTEGKDRRVPVEVNPLVALRRVPFEPTGEEPVSLFMLAAFQQLVRKDMCAAHIAAAEGREAVRVSVLILFVWLSEHWFDPVCV